MSGAETGPGCEWDFRRFRTDTEHQAHEFFPEATSLPRSMKG